MVSINPAETLQRFRLGERIFLLGSYESGVTVLSQQVRALNLAWAMVESLERDHLSDIAIVGGGFAGLTVAAALLRKGAKKLTLFEKRPVLCPLQQGNDTRWLHPHIYDWPAKASEVPSAALPLLNWTAGRASDVVAQILASWEELKAGAPGALRQLLNTKYLRVDQNGTIEWVADNAAADQPKGDKKPFTAIVLAVGFGEEKGTISYWRNESISQPQLGPARQVFLISGYGDGALLDLFRLRISQFRQDRILDELFRGQTDLRDRLREYKEALDRDDTPLSGVYEAFEKIATDNATSFQAVLKALQARLRDDTSVVLHVHRERAKAFMDVFAHKSSLQNKFLLYCLFKLGAFIPTQKEVDAARAEYAVHRVIKRHGPEPDGAIQEVLGHYFFESSEGRRKEIRKDGQPDNMRWLGGYWDTPSEKFDGGPNEDVKQHWRQEYLPTATALLAGTFATAVASILSDLTAGNKFRVVLHRVIETEQERLLQQACEYRGRPHRGGAHGRTFRDQGIIGLAFRQQRVCRTREIDSASLQTELQSDMRALKLGEDSQQMSSEVRSLLAVPVLAGGNTIMVLYADSHHQGLFSDAVVRKVVEMTSDFCAYLQSIDLANARNFPQERKLAPTSLAEPALKVVETLPSDLFPPPVSSLESVNFEFTSYRA